MGYTTEFFKLRECRPSRLLGLSFKFKFKLKVGKGRGRQDTDSGRDSGAGWARAGVDPVIAGLG